MSWTRRMLIDQFHALYLRVGPVSEVTSKHRAALLGWSLVALFIDQGAKVTFGDASIAGLGISVDPPQTLPIGLLISLVLAYRLFAMRFVAMSDAGTDEGMARTLARVQHDPESFVPPEAETDHDRAMEAAERIQNEWGVRRMVWDLLLPTVLGLIAMIWQLL